MAAWALAPWANAGADLLLDVHGTSAVWEQSDRLIVLNHAALSFAVVVTITVRSASLTGSRRFVRRRRRSWTNDARASFSEMN